LLLAAGADNLPYRRTVKEELTKYGYSNVIIMEDLPEDDKGICFKFEGILDKYDPHLIITFFHNEVKRDSILFELGFICGKSGIEFNLKRLKFLHNGFKFDETTPYIRELLPFISNVQYDESNEYEKSSKLINVWAKNRCKELQELYLSNPLGYNIQSILNKNYSSQHPKK